MSDVSFSVADLAEHLDAVKQKWVKKQKDYELILQTNGDVICLEPQYLENPRFFQGVRRDVERELGVAQINAVPSQKFESLLRLDSTDERDDQKEQKQRAAVESLNLQARDILKRGIDAASSDIYVDITEKKCVVSHRTYGLKLPLEGEFPVEHGMNICRAIWTLGENTTFVADKACDAAFSYMGQRFRCSSLPGIHGGVGVVLRMRDPNFHLPLEICGYSERQVNAIRSICESPGGLILITGETNSGKSSTLATIMGDLPTVQKIIEISDPIEVEFEHVTQVEIPRNTDDDDVRFEEILAGLVRQNPDTLILGEMRDSKTAQAAMSMALQGKRVLSTLHTQSCMLSFSRMRDLGVDESLLYKAGFIAGVVNQNLIPVLCPVCKLEKPATAKLRETIGSRHQEMFGDVVRYANTEGKCSEVKCRHGVVGQSLVAEVYPMVFDRDGSLINLLRDDRLEKSEIERFVSEQWGMETKQQHAWSKIVGGDVDAYHVERVIGRLDPDRDGEYPVDPFAQ